MNVCKISNKVVWPGLALGVILAIASVGVGKAAGGSGEELYGYYCAACHGTDADGKGPNATEDLPTAPKDFTDPKNLPAITDQQIEEIIRKGGPVEKLSFVMPSWGKIIPDREVELLRGYLREKCRCEYDPKVAAEVAAEAEKK